MKISDFIKRRGRPVITIGPEVSLYDAIQKLVENKIGALPVCDEKTNLIGIVSERDLMKSCLSGLDSLKRTPVKEIMTRNVAVGHLEDDLDNAAAVMKKQRIRHLPIVIGQKIESMISMRDIIETQLRETEAEVNYIGLIKKSRIRR